jgi:TPR repeat protein
MIGQNRRRSSRGLLIALIWATAVIFSLPAHSETPLDDLIQRAKGGNAEAEFELGGILYKESLNGTQGADIESLRWLRTFLQHKDIEPILFAAAEFMIGMEFYQTCADYPDYISFGSCGPSREGRHLVQDYKQAQEHLRAAAEAGPSTHSVSSLNSVVSSPTALT